VALTRKSASIESGDIAHAMADALAELIRCLEAA
jgi:hypothetical protein